MFEKLDRDPKNYPPVKIVNIITAFEEEDADPMKIAKHAGFQDHKDMAGYMRAKGYKWNINKSNYIKAAGRIEETVPVEEPPQTPIKATGQKIPNSMNEYVPFIQFLYEKRDDIYQLLSGTKEDGKIPRYAIPGLARTKAIYMSDMVAKMTGEFSRKKNITQREIVEGALIEYLQKYGFKREIEALLKNQ